MSITTHIQGRGSQVYDPYPLDNALCELCGTLLDDGRETDAGVCDACADAVIEPTEAGLVFVQPSPTLYGLQRYPVVLVEFPDEPGCPTDAAFREYELEACASALCEEEPPECRYPTLAERLAESIRDDRRA